MVKTLTRRLPPRGRFLILNAFMHWLIHPEEDVSGFELACRILVSLLLAYWSWHFLATPITALGNEWTFMHLIHTVFHEAGHILLMWAPKVVVMLGGSLGQLAMPLGLMFAFLIRVSWR